MSSSARACPSGRREDVGDARLARDCRGAHDGWCARIGVAREQAGGGGWSGARHREGPGECAEQQMEAISPSACLRRAAARHDGGWWRQSHAARRIEIYRCISLRRRLVTRPDGLGRHPAEFDEMRYVGLVLIVEDDLGDAAAASNRGGGRPQVPIKDAPARQREQRVAARRRAQASQAARSKNSFGDPVLLVGDAW